MKIAYFLVFFSVWLFGDVSISLSHTNIANGSTFRVLLQSSDKLKQAPNVIFKTKTYQMFTISGNTTEYEAYIPVDYYSKIGQENVQIKYKEHNETKRKNISIKISKGDYKQNEIITVPKGKVTLSKKSKNRAIKEYATVYKNVYSQITAKSYTTNSKFISPIKSIITSAFGTARVYNGTTKSYHTGTDYRAKTATAVKASNNGKVALVMKRFYLGNVVYIDHGHGAYSYYSHLSSTKVKQGQSIKAGDILGYSGATGRVTAPHLHYAFRLYNVTVDPLQFMKLHNRFNGGDF